MTMRTYSLAYLSSHRCAPPEAIRVAAANGYAFVGLRLWPNAPGAPQQFLLDKPEVLRETVAAQKDTGVGVFDLEIIRIGEQFDPHAWDALYDAGAALKAKAILVAGDDANEARLTDNYARLCEVMQPYGMTADLEFMPWTAVKDAQSALRIITNAGTPSNAGILVDALHFGRSTTTLDDIRAIPRPLLHYAQICDAQAGTHFTSEQMIQTARCERLLPGDGSINVQGLFDALPADLPISVEVVNFAREEKASPSEWAAICLAASCPFVEPRI
jgi:sugar phosphate isomerase/epimerase